MKTKKSPAKKRTAKKVASKKKYKTTKQKNAEFAKMSPERQRVAIARDVLAQIRAEKFVPRMSVFCNINTFDVPAELDLQKNQSLQDFFTKKEFKESTCTVCAKGALFMSAVKFKNEFTLGDMSYDNTETDHSGMELEAKEMKKLQELFSPMQLSMIETAFEGTVFNYNIPLSESMENKCKKFYKKYKTADDTLIAICQNIIKNKGTFKP